jgi:ornithine carbamoyltransferase
MARHFLTVADLGYEVLDGLTNDAVAIARGLWADRRPLAGRFVGIYFSKTSTRTRTSFSVGAMRLGAQIVTYGPNDLQIVTGETVEDTGRVLAEYLDLLVVRTNEPLAGMAALAAQGRMGVINAMSDNEHPTQAIADLAVIKEQIGRLEGVHVLCLGEGNNTAAAQILAAAQVPGMRFTLVTPEGYGLPVAVLDQAHALAGKSGAVVLQHHRADMLPRGVDVVYTSRWTTMGVPKLDPDWLPRFRPYAVTRALMAEVSKPGGGTVFLHDLPAMRGFEVTDEVLDGPGSRALRLAFHKMTSAMAVLSYCAGAT